ncbi:MULTISPECIES: aminotransferase class V-fold PLP-dependent enzyme [Catenuloplanes]|uniref:Isopenicillin-N epimerase n=1 Tax=Catenuloplanes niger TaxID=587534 RepID=A0AAE4CU34_9ACTN|nr:aminotransferase class V-fold PLP-dependent enzyme [Catenuloplanes niger]MDR7326006.1 isopenicillin-N epimerase [Catenuloplanes niger]
MNADWPLSADMLHLNHGSFGAVPRFALEVQAALRAEMESAPVRWFAGLPRRLAAARTEIARFLRTAPDTLALVPNASAGVSAVLAGLPFPHGGEIIVTDHGYGAVVMGAERLARRRRGTVRTVHVPLDAGPDEAAAAVLGAITARTALIVVDHLTSPTARFLPVDLIGRAARERGIPFLVDAAHVPALLGDPLAGLDCDAWVGNLHKFGCAPRSTGVLVARGPHTRALHPLVDSWGAPLPYPERFDVQGTLDVTATLAAPATLTGIEARWGWSTIRSRATELAGAGAAVVAAAFTAITGEDHAVPVGMPAGPMRLVRLPGTLGTGPGAPDALRARTLDELAAECAFGQFGGVGYLRLSAHAYSTLADFEEFAERCVPALARRR